MSPRSRHGANARHHIEWLQLVDVSGPFLSLSVLVETFPQGLDADDPDIAKRLGQAYGEWQANEDLRRPDPAIHREFIRLVLREVLEYEGLLGEDAEIADLNVVLPEHRITLRPDLAVRRSGEKPALLIATYRGGKSLERPLDERGFHASPAERMRLLLRGANVRTGLVTNGEEWMLVHAPADRTSTFVTWQTQLLLEERITLRAFRSLLSAHRLFGVPEPETLDGLFERSGDDEREVTDQLGRQVRRAVEMLVAAFDEANRASNGRLTEAVRELERNEEVPETLYETAVVIAMRVIFLLAAEARGLLPDEGPWVESYAVTPLRAELQETADRTGPELLDRRFDAWPRLLATFRAIHGGVGQSRIRLPGYGGGLFDPARYPFLESVDGALLRISNRAILHVLDAIQTLEVEVPGGRERRPLSFRALGVEQIGHVYEGLLDHTAIRADAPAVGLVGTTKKEPELALAELERTRDEGEDVLLDLLKEETGRGIAALRRTLSAEPDPERLARLRTTCQRDDSLFRRITPFLALVRDDAYGMPMVFQEGSVYVTISPGRRATGTHYTPPSLTEPIVRFALEPVVYVGPAEGLEPEHWTLRPPHELLELKVCDIAMGSAAFLVAACRYLAARLVQAWEQHPDEMPADAGADPEERDLTARRVVAERCLYGVDKNALAVEIAKVSMWLTTMRRDRPFTFLDHALRHGDSLLGATSVAQLERLTLDPQDTESVLLEPARAAIRATLAEVRALRERIEATDAIDLREVKEKTASLSLVEERTQALRTVCDLIVGAWLEEAAGDARASTIVEAAVEDISAVLLAGADAHQRQPLARIEARAGNALLAGRAPGDPDPPRPFHWVLEFPEALQRERKGFDAIIGNPPFLGGVRISEVLGDPTNVYLATLFPPFSRRVDLSAYFLRRAGSLLSEGGTFGLLGSKSVSQGTTRRGGLDQLVGDGFELFRSVKAYEWPGEAAVVAAQCWAYRGKWKGLRVADSITCKFITTLLDPADREVSEPKRLAANRGHVYQGTGIWGEGFFVPADVAAELLADQPGASDVVKRAVGGEELNGPLGERFDRWIIDMDERDEDEAREYPGAFQYLERTVKEWRQSKDPEKYSRIVKSWWKFFHTRQKLYQGARDLGLSRVLARARVGDYHMVDFLPVGILYTEQLIVFLHDDFSSFASIQSSIHEMWARKYGSSFGSGNALRYIATDCFETFPLPKSTSLLEEAGQELWELRTAMHNRGDLSLLGIYREFNNPSSALEDVSKLRNAHARVDHALRDAYGWSDLELDHDFRETGLGLRYAISETEKGELLGRLLTLNDDRYEDEVRRGLHVKGKPKAQRRATAAANRGSATLFDDG